MTKNVEVAVVGTELEEDVFWTVPLIDYFLYEIFAITKSKANWPFVALPARVALNVQLHLIIVAQNGFDLVLRFYLVVRLRLRRHSATKR